MILQLAQKISIKITVTEHKGDMVLKYNNTVKIICYDSNMIIKS